VHSKHQKAIKLRLKGKSYREITKTLGVSKSSVSLWCRDLKLPIRIQKIIDAKTKNSRTNLTAYNKKRSQFIKTENKEIRKKAIKQISSLSERELLLIGASLFWGEGYKKAENLRSPYICFANSDADMIKLFMNFLRKIMKISSDRIYASVFIYPSIEEKKAINFWSKVTKLPKSRFRTTNQISRASKGKRPYNSLPYGTLDLRVNSRQEFFWIRGWIDGLIKQIK